MSDVRLASMRAMVLAGLLAMLCLVACQRQPAAEPALLLAVASNFAEPARQLAQAFAEQTGVEVKVSTGSTGKLYHQIIQGGPFHVFMAADSKRPLLLKDQGLVWDDISLVYAVGTLWLWQPAGAADTDCLANMLAASDKISIANPVTAPFGLAAQQAMLHFGITEQVDQRIVMGENISQAYLFVASGNAGFGFIANAQAVTVERGCLQLIPAKVHDPLAQMAVIVKPHQHALAWLEYLQSTSAMAIMDAFGYLPAASLAQ